MTTLHLHWSRATLHISAEVMPEVMSILVLTTKPHQHFIRTEAMPTFIFVMKPWQHSTLAFTLAIKVAPMHWATSKLHFHRSYANIHEATKSRQHFICIEAVPMVNTSFAPMLCQRSSLSWSHVNISFAPKPCRHSSFPWSYVNTYWSCANIHLFHEAMTTLHLYWSHANIHEAMSKLHLHQSHADIHLCHEAMSTFTEVVPTFIFSMKPQQHFICIEAVSTFMKPCQNSICTNAVPTFMKPWSRVNTSY